MRLIYLLFVALSLCCCDTGFQSVTLINMSDESKDDIKSMEIPIYTRSHKIERVETSGLPFHQLGKLGDDSLGDMDADIVSRVSLSTVNPTFGLYSQHTEDKADTDKSIYTIPEEETVTKVELHIPFISHIKRDKTGIVARDGDKNLYELESVYGDQNASFKIKVEQLTYYLGDFDTDVLSNKKSYYSDTDYSKFKGETLYDGNYRIDRSEHLTGKEDNRKTKEDESRLVPRIILQLNKDFFQSRIIDQEGSEKMIDNHAFWNYIRGIYISAYDYTSDVMMLLEYSKAYIEITYTYKKLNDNGTPSDTSDDNLETKEGTFKLNLFSKAFNIFRKQDGSKANTGVVNADKIYQKGPFLLTEIRLFDDEGTSFLDGIRQKKRLINDASIIFHADAPPIQADKFSSPMIYIFNLDDSGNPIRDYHKIKRIAKMPVIDGGTMRYKFSITDHFNGVINDEIPNSRLGIILTSQRVDHTITTKAYSTDDSTYDIPKASVIMPTGITFFGASEKVEKSKRLKLEVQYTEIEN